MWSSLNEEELSTMRAEIMLLHIAGDEGGAMAWLLWAEMCLNTLEVPEPNMVAARAIFPVVVWLSRTMEIPIEAVQNALHESLPRILWQAKLAGRELDVTDGHAAIRIVRGGLKEADG